MGRIMTVEIPRGKTRLKIPILSMRKRKSGAHEVSNKKDKPKHKIDYARIEE